MAQLFSAEQALAVAAVREAARLCQMVQRRITPEVLAKKDRSPVTVADFGSQALVCRALREQFRDDPIVAEEDSADLRRPENRGVLEQVLRDVQQIRACAGPEEVCAWIDAGKGREYSPRFWTLDPIDGTKGFLRAEQYAVSLALMIDGRVEVAALACPNLPREAGADAPCGLVFTAVRGAGAVALPLEGDGPAVPIEVSRCSWPEGARFCESVESGHSAHGDSAKIAERLGIRRAPIRLDSQAKYAVVARGEAEIYLRMPTRADYREKIWDHAGGVLIVTEAGGTVTDITGRPLNFRLGPELQANRGVVVSNGPFHAEILAAISVLGLGQPTPSA
jgi:3'(2'), 5'-bisphosphate nucleotidase